MNSRAIMWLSTMMFASLIAASAAMSDAQPAAPPGAAATDPAAAFKALEQWTDGYEAWKQGQTSEYNQALRKAGESLSTLTDAEVRQRLLAHVDDLEEAARWQSFIMTPMPADNVRKLPWNVIRDDLTKLDILIGNNLTNIAVYLKPNTLRDFQLAAIVQLEKEMPVIKAHRIALAQKVCADVYGIPMMKLSQSTVDQIRELAASK